MAANSPNHDLRSSCSFPNLLISCLSLVLLILSAASLVPTLLLRLPPTTFGLSLLMVSATSLVSAFLGLWAHLTPRLCFCSHVSLVLASLAGQVLAVLALFTKEAASLSMLRSTRDPREAKLLVRLECGALVAMVMVQVVVLVLAWLVHGCWVKEYEELEERKQLNSTIMKAKSEFGFNAKVNPEAGNKAKVGDEKMVKWVKTDFEG